MPCPKRKGRVLSIETLTRCFATRQALRYYYCSLCSLLDLRDAAEQDPGVPLQLQLRLRSAAHKLFSALLDLDGLLDEELGPAHEIKDALVKGKEAVDELREAKAQLREATTA